MHVVNQHVRLIFGFITLALIASAQPTLAQDADNDGVPDGADNCTNVFNPAQLDEDADLAGNVCDCTPQEDITTELIGAVDDLIFSSKSDLSWTVPVDGTPFVFDLLRSSSPDLTTVDCLESDESDQMAVDANTPAANQVFYYALRAQNACGGNLGADSQESRRPGAACPSGSLLPLCAENMDATCPSTAPACTGVSFTGGTGCFREFLGNCYDTGLFSYKVVEAQPLTIEFADDVSSVEVFFAPEVATVAGEMRFFDIDNLEVGNGISTSPEICSGAIMPPRQNFSLGRPVRRVEVAAAGIGDVWIDTFTINPNAFLPTCTETMDATCPNVSPSCTGVSFTGGVGCFVEFIANCYSSGMQSFKVTQPTPLTIDFSSGVNSLDVFFSHEVAGTTGTMRFFDDNGVEVDSPIASNGPCSGVVMPPTQSLTFSRPVRSIDVTVAGTGDVWIDTFTLNP
jgi:hypothetical protein